jgi:uncharacterized damage-inducible protein DinB
MTFTASLLKEMENESRTTRKILERVPDGNYDWKPHEKSMSIRQLATHVAEITGWLPLILNTDEMDFTKMDYKPAAINTQQELIAHFEKSLAEGMAALSAVNDEKLINETWTMRSGDIIHSAESRLDNVRHCYCQIVHHRAQLGVYLRLLNIPLPGSYGPSADDTSF